MSGLDLNVDDILKSSSSIDESEDEYFQSTPSNLPTMSNNTPSSTVSLSSSASLDTLQQLLSAQSTPSTFNDIYTRNQRLFSLSTQPLISPIEQRLQQHVYATTSSSTSSTPSIDSPSSNKAQTNLFSFPKLANITHQLDEKKQFTGVPTAVITNNRFICIGTSLGFIWVFDHFQTRYGCFGTAKEHRSETFTRGPIISLDITPDGEFIIAAHRNGAIVIWELVPKTILKVIDDFILPNNVPNPQTITNVLQVLSLPHYKPSTLSTKGGKDNTLSSSHQTNTNTTKEDRHHITFLFANTNGGISIVNLQKKFLVWTSDIKWIMNNADKPILHVALLPPAPITTNSSNNSALDNASGGLTRSLTTLGSKNATDLTLGHGLQHSSQSSLGHINDTRMFFLFFCLYLFCFFALTLNIY